jgi:hypothetical protein
LNEANTALVAATPVNPMPPVLAPWDTFYVITGSAEAGVACRVLVHRRAGKHE